MKLVIFGLGRIGLPISLVCADSGYHVTGIDINQQLINNLKKGQIAFEEKEIKKLLTKHLNKNFFPKNQKENITNDLKQADYIMIAVGTGFAKYPEKPNLSTLYSIFEQIIKTGIRNKTIILRVTLPIGTTNEIKKLIENKTNLKEGKDYWLSFVPERTMEGKAVEEERRLPKIVGSFSDQGYKKIKTFFNKIGGDIVRVSNPKTAEFVKLIDNSWRNTRFAFANELAFLADENKINAIEAIQSANKEYKRNEIPWPGPVSGYCLGKDPYLLELAFGKIADKRKFGSLWFYGRRANDWFNEKIIEEVEGKNILVAGLSFKENIDDYRYSHSMEIIRNLLRKKYKVTVCDPFLNNNYYTKLPEDIKDKVKGFNTFKEALSKNIETIIFTTRHDEFKKINIKNISKNVKIIDLWNMFKIEEIGQKNYKGFGTG